MNNACTQNLSVAASIAAILAGITLAGYAPAARAAEETAGELEEVTVTGSRIVRRDYQSNSPLVSIDSAALESQSSLNIESYLNQLPAYNPAGSPAVKGGLNSNTDLQISPVNTIGVATVSLRGFGPNRSLVLVDGRRVVPTNSLMVIDVNGIPSSMIKRVEIISGGASAVYGADAVGGVSNFLLRRDFEGVEIDGQFGTTEAGDGDELRTSMIVGGKFGEDKGHFSLAAEYYDRHAAFEKNRDYFTNAWANPDAPGNLGGTSILGANGYYTFLNPPNVATLGAILSGRPAGTGVYPFGSNGNRASLRFNPDGTIFDPAGRNANSWRGAAIDSYRYTLANNYDTSLCNSPNTTTCPAGATPGQFIKYAETEGYVNSPQTRYSFMASTTYDLTDSIKLMSSARFAQSITKTYASSSSNAQYGFEVQVPYNATVDSPVNPGLAYTNPAVVAQVLANPAAFANPSFIPHGAAGAQHPVPLQMAILLNSRPTAPSTSTWVMELWPLFSGGLHDSDNRNTQWQIETGVTFDLPFKDWTAEVYYSRGQSEVYSLSDGNYSLARLRGLVTAADYGRNSQLQSNRTPPNGPGANPGFASLPVPCTSGFYEMIFNGDARPTEDCNYAVNAPLQSQAANQQDIVELNFQGGMFSLPAGELRSAFGFQGRRNASQFSPDMLQSTASFTDQVIGLYPTGYLDASTKARDYYGELLVPVLQDFFVRKLELELGGRYSDYDQTDSTTTYKINANIEINHALRLRGGYNRATRAPNLGEMFLPLQQLYTSTGAYGDPCGVLSNSPFGAGGAAANPVPASGGTARLANGQTTAGANSAYLICRAQMGATAANFFYGNVQPSATGGALGSLNQVGNPGLDSEKADTWTAGVVIQSPFEHPLLSRMSATFDWYQISINDAILPYSADYARFLCYGAVQVGDAAAAAAQASSSACSVMQRDPSTGAYVTSQVSYANQAKVATSGVDFTFDWNASFADMGLGSVPGSLNLNIQGSWLDYYRTKQSPASFDPVIDWKGSLGPFLTGFNVGSYDYRLFTSLTYKLPNLSVGLRWRHLPSVVTYQKAQEDALKKNNEAVAAGGAGTLLSYTPVTFLPASSYDVFDLTGSWNITDALSLRVGVNNVLDKDPLPIATAGIGGTALTTGYPVGTDLNAVCQGAPGCVNPTSYSLPVKGLPTSNGGYYDELGRRFYIGLKAVF